MAEVKLLTSTALQEAAGKSAEAGSPSLVRPRRGAYVKRYVVPLGEIQPGSSGEPLGL